MRLCCTKLPDSCVRDKQRGSGYGGEKGGRKQLAFFLLESVKIEDSSETLGVGSQIVPSIEHDLRRARTLIGASRKNSPTLFFSVLQL